MLKPTAWTLPTLNIREDWNQGYSIYKNTNVHGHLPTLGPTGERNLVCFKAERLLLHQVIVEMSVGIKHMKIPESDFQRMISTEYQKLLVTHGERLVALNSEYAKAVQTVGSERNPGNLANIKAEYESKVLSSIQRMARDRVEEIQIQHPKLAIEAPYSFERETLMVAGGQASGKGTSVGLLADKMGDKWEHTVRINTDSYKPLVLAPDNLAPEIYSQLAQQEASLIHGKLQTRLGELEQQGKCPHVLVDQVFLGSDKLDLAIKSSGKSEIIAVSTKVETAIARSFGRGAETGRYEDTKGILRCHKFSTEQMMTTLAGYDGEDVNFTLVDNNVPKGDTPIRCMSVDLKDQTIVIHNEARMREYLKKLNININATGEDNLYGNAALSLKDYLEPLISKGYTVTLGQSGLKLSSQEKILICLDHIADLNRLEEAGFEAIDIDYMDDEKLTQLLSNSEGIKTLAIAMKMSTIDMNFLSSDKLDILLSKADGIRNLADAGFDKNAISMMDDEVLAKFLDNSEGIKTLATAMKMSTIDIKFLSSDKLDILLSKADGIRNLADAGFDKNAVSMMDDEKLAKFLDKSADVVKLSALGFSDSDLTNMDEDLLDQLLDNSDVVSEMITKDNMRPFNLSIQSADALGELIQVKKQSMALERDGNLEDNVPRRDIGFRN
jgi:uncharacterized ubiquitin-like protein YukD